MPRLIIEDGDNRIVPRKFQFQWGKGYIIEEVFVKCILDTGRRKEMWEPTIQLLRYEDGSTTLRFCVYSGKKLRRMPPLMDRQILVELGKRIENTKLIRELLSNLNGVNNP
jgi:hypothetical protein